MAASPHPSNNALLFLEASIDVMSVLESCFCPGYDFNQLSNIQKSRLTRIKIWQFYDQTKQALEVLGYSRTFLDRKFRTRYEFIINRIHSQYGTRQQIPIELCPL